MTGTIRKWAVADGRDALGTVRLDDSGKFIAIDVDGKTLGKFSRLLEAANAFDDAKEALTNMITQTNRDIKKALNALMKACGLSGESGTEQLYEILSGIVLERDREIRATVGGEPRQWFVLRRERAACRCSRRGAFADV
jgi:hypothetical protein